MYLSQQLSRPKAELTARNSRHTRRGQEKHCHIAVVAPMLAHGPRYRGNVGRRDSPAIFEPQMAVKCGFCVNNVDLKKLSASANTEASRNSPGTDGPASDAAREQGGRRCVS